MLHQIVIIPDNRGAAGFGTTMDLALFPDDIAVADLEKALLALIGEILGSMADHCPHVNFIVFSNVSPPGQDSMGENTRSLPNADGPIDDHIGADIDARINLSLRINDGCGMDRHARAAIPKNNSMQARSSRRQNNPFALPFRQGCSRYHWPRRQRQACDSELNKKDGRGYPATGFLSGKLDTL